MNVSQRGKDRREIPLATVQGYEAVVARIGKDALTPMMVSDLHLRRRLDEIRGGVWDLDLTFEHEGKSFVMKCSNVKEFKINEYHQLCELVLYNISAWGWDHCRIEVDDEGASSYHFYCETMSLE